MAIQELDKIPPETTSCDNQLSLSYPPITVTRRRRHNDGKAGCAETPLLEALRLKTTTRSDRSAISLKQPFMQPANLRCHSRSSGSSAPLLVQGLCKAFALACKPHILFLRDQLEQRVLSLSNKTTSTLQTSGRYVKAIGASRCRKPGQQRT
ncbi:hypothetical protein BDW02DRAFT_132970 [Decorospora gaudefroyi]|uniref:Uncharacterized protein n=1 Tax=Decorospora gaudefroyi TaxID=184978 RepID=A0A6A5K0R8_9PLEO|nr:hypothetical protein BDW02DRAFT_132970 [Decorospora gaudefroyi]